MIHHIKSHIERMKEKPHHIKKQYAFFVSLAITLMIFGTWMSSFGVKTQEVSLADKSKGPIASLTASAGDAVKSIGGVFVYAKELFFGANETKYSSDNVEVVGAGKN